MLETKFIQLTYYGGTRTYVKADAIVQLVEEKDGGSFVYILNDNSPMTVRESMDEVLAKIGVCAW